MSRDDDLWALEKQLRTLQDCRAEKRGVWNDEAARTINERYLDLLDNAAKEQVTALKSCQEQLSEASKHAQQIENLQIQLNELGSEIEHNHPEIINGIKSADTNRDTSGARCSEAMQSIKQAGELIEQADQIGSH